jgi:hypothetical protein
MYTGTSIPNTKKYGFLAFGTCLCMRTGTSTGISIYYKVYIMQYDSQEGIDSRRAILVYKYVY